MTASDQSSDLVSGYLDLLRRPPAVPEAAVSFLSDAWPQRDAGKPCALILSPHPDDECLTGALPLRLRQEQGWQIVNIALTLGSDGARRAARKRELAKACKILNFDCLLPQADGFSAVTTQTRDVNPQAWRPMAAHLAEILAHFQPQAIFMPHPLDAHPAHIGTHLLGTDALAALPAEFSCAVIQTEYWQPLAEPNLMIGVSAADTALLLQALACHAGENARNPFDVRFPAYLIDNVRRGSERVGGAGVFSAPMDFAMLYRLGLWRGGKFMPSALNRMIGCAQGLDELTGVIAPA